MSETRAAREKEQRYRRRPRWAGRARFAETAHVVRRLLVGTPLPTHRLRREKLPKRLALPVFSSDPLSSVAYATEQAMVVLFAVSISGRSMIPAIALAVALLLAILVLSYRQTVRAYSTSGGAYPSPKRISARCRR